MGESAHRGETFEKLRFQVSMKGRMIIVNTSTTTPIVVTMEHESSEGAEERLNDVYAFLMEGLDL